MFSIFYCLLYVTIHALEQTGCCKHRPDWIGLACTHQSVTHLWTCMSSLCDNYVLLDCVFGGKFGIGLMLRQCSITVLELKNLIVGWQTWPPKLTLDKLQAGNIDSCSSWFVDNRTNPQYLYRSLSIFGKRWTLSMFYKWMTEYIFLESTQVRRVCCLRQLEAEVDPRVFNHKVYSLP